MEEKIVDGMDDLEKWMNGFVSCEPEDHPFFKIIHFAK